MEEIVSGNSGNTFKIKADKESAAFIGAIEKIGNQFNLGV